MMINEQKWQKNGLYNTSPILDRNILIAMDVEMEGKKFFYCSDVCEIRKCCMEKELENCAACEMYICDRLKAFITLAPEAGNALDKLRMQYLA